MTQSATQEDLVQHTLKQTWDLFKNDFVLWVVAGLVMIIVTIASLGILSGPMTVGYIQLIERRRMGQPGSVTDIFDGFSHFGVSLIASILIGLGVFIGMFLFILPGVLFGLSMAFTFQAIAIHHEGATSAMGKSFELIKDNLALSAVFLVIVLVLSGIGGAVVFGTLVTMPFTMLLMTLAYHGLNERSA